jgi:hypothetical protein
MARLLSMALTIVVYTTTRVPKYCGTADKTVRIL